MTLNIYNRLGSIQYVKARVIQDTQSLQPTSTKSGVALAEVGEHYYVPDFDPDNQADVGLGRFVEIVDDPAAKLISVKRLRYMPAWDLSKANSIGELIALIYPQYLNERNYFDVVDKSIEVLAHYYPEHVETLLNKAEQIYYLDLKWLTTQSLPERIKQVSVDIFNHDGNVRSQQPNQTEYTWDLLQEAAVLTITFVDNAKLKYIVYPTFDGLRTSIRLIRLEDGLELYTDRHGNLHGIDFKKLIGDFLHFELDNITAKYYVNHQRAAITPIGSGAGNNTPMMGHEFALSYIDPTNIPNVTQFLTDIERIEKGQQDEQPKTLTMETADGSHAHDGQHLRGATAESNEQNEETVGDNNPTMGEAD